MKHPLACIIALGLALAGFASAPALAEGDDTAFGRAGRQSHGQLPVEIADYRARQIERFAKNIAVIEAEYISCPPGREMCTRRRAFASQPALRGSAPWMAQITLPELWESSEDVPLPASDWAARHFCGGALIAPGWVVTAAHCVDDRMLAEGWRVRVGMSNLALDDGRYFTIDRIICFNPEHCRNPPEGPRYRDDIALLHFTPAPGDLAAARDPVLFADVGVEAALLAADARELVTWSQDQTRRRWDAQSGAELERTARADGDLLPRSPAMPGTLAAEPTRDLLQMQLRLTTRDLRLSWVFVPLPEAEQGPSRMQLRLDAQTPAGPVMQAELETGVLNEVQLAPDESWFLAVIGRPCPCQLSAHDTATLRELWSVELAFATSDLDDPNLRWDSPRILALREDAVLVGNGDEVLLLDPASGALRQRFTHPRSPSYQSEHGGAADDGQHNFVRNAQLSADGRHMVTATNRFGEGDVWLWDTASTTPQRRIAQPDPLLSEWLEGAVLLRGGTQVLSWTRYGTYRVWDAASGRELLLMRQRLPLEQARLMRQDTMIAIFDEAGVSNFDLASGREIARFDHLREQIGGTISPDETRALTWSEDGTARVWDIDRGTEARRIYHNGDVYGAAFMPDPAAVLSWSDDGTARITSIADGAVAMAFDVADNPPGAPLALPLSQRPPRGAEVAYLPLATPQRPDLPGLQVDIYGWGKTQAAGTFDPYATLMTVNLTALENSACADLPGMGARYQVHAGVFCARDEYQKTCKGDSGGPVVNDGVLVGIVSWGKIECTGNGEPGVYTRIAAYREWIGQQVGETALAPLPPDVRVQ